MRATLIWFRIRSLGSLCLLCLFLLSILGKTDAEGGYRQIQVLGRGAANSVKWNPAGDQIVIAGTGGIWFYTDAFELLRYLDIGEARSFAWSPDGNYFAYSNQHGMAYIFSAETYTATTEIDNIGGVVFDLAWNSQSTQIAVASADGIARTYDLTGGLVQSFSGHIGGVKHVAFNSTGEFIATVDAGMSQDEYGIEIAPDTRNLHIWNVETAQEIETLALGANVYGMAWHPRQANIVALSVELPLPIRTWNMETRQFVQSVGPVELQGIPRLLVWSSDGSLIAMPNGGEVLILDGATLQTVTRLRSDLSWRSMLTMAWSPDGTKIMGSFGDTIQIWDVVSRTLLTTFDEHTIDVDSIDWRPDTMQVAGISRLGETIDLWDVETGERTPIGAHLTHPGLRSAYFDTEWNATGQSLAFLTENISVIWVWDSQNATFERIPVEDTFIQCIAWHPIEENLLLTGELDMVRVWDMNSKTPMISFSTSDDVVDVAWSSDGRFIAGATRVGQIFVWDSETRMEIATLEKERVHEIAFSPDGALLGVAGDDVTVWDFATGEQIAELMYSDSSVTATAWHPVLPLLASGNENGEVIIWNTQDGSVSAAMEAHVAMITDIDWSLDGSYLATASRDGTIRIWRWPK